jgi:two-component system, OmpR family, phosphate regulon response regulator PhoB
MGATILVVEDEPAIQQLISTSLQHAGYAVLRAADGETALRLVREALPDLILLDWMLPGMSGVQLARCLRVEERTKNVPLIMLTARSEEQDKITGLETGADDYVTKPFSITELLARVRAVLRRAGTVKAPAAADVVTIGDIEIDFKLHQARRGQTRIEFTAREFDLLRYFVQHVGQVVTREQILNEVWGYEEFPTTRTIDNFVAKLRQKIERAPHAPEHILTIHGSGYKFVG